MGFLRGSRAMRDAGRTEPLLVSIWGWGSEPGTTQKSPVSIRKHPAPDVLLAEFPKMCALGTSKADAFSAAMPG